MSERQRRTLQSRPRLAEKTFRYPLADSLAKGPVVLYFFPAAFSVGCSLEAHEFAEAIGKFEALGALRDGLERRHGKPDQVFGAGWQGNFPAASDSAQAVVAAYDAVMALRADYAKTDLVRHLSRPARSSTTTRA